MRGALTRFACAALLALAAASAHANDWGNFAIISNTLGNHAGRLCVGEGLRVSDIGCPTYAPSITTAGDVSITGNVSANKFIGDGSLLTGVGQSDRIVSGTTNVIATQDRSVTISTAGMQRVVVGENGNIGIGTSAPSTSLHLYSATPEIRFTDSGNSAYHTRMRQAGSAFSLFSGVSNGTITIGGSATGALNLHTNPNSTGLRFLTSNTEYMRLTVDGSLGLGTTTPAATLQVSGSFIVSTSAQNTTPSLYVGTNGNVGVGTSAPASLLHISGTLGGWTFSNTGAVMSFRVNGWNYLTAPGASGRLVFQTGGANHRMTIEEGGDVGIGTTDPSTSLHVSGTVRANQYCDYDGNNCSAGMGGGSSDRITSGTNAVTVNSSSGYVSLSTSGTDWGYLTSAISYLPSIFTTSVSSTRVSATNISTTLVDATRNGTVSATYLNGRYLSATDVAAARINATNISGTLIQVGNNGAVCNSTISGSLRFSQVSSTLEYCNSVAWIGVANSTDTSLTAFTVTKNAAQTGINSGDVVTWEAVTTNNGGAFNLSTERFVAPASGYYFFIFSGTTNADTSVGSFYIYKNGTSTVLRAYGGQGTEIYKAMTAQGVLYLAAGDYVDVRSAQASQTLYGAPGGPISTFSGFLLNAGGVSTGGASTLAALTDVDTSGASPGNILSYNGSQWVVSNTATSLSDRIVSGTTNVIATQDRSVTISTAGTQRMMVGENGRVGIGTDTPEGRLHVFGTMFVGGTGSSVLKLGTASVGNQFSYIDLVGDDTYTDFGLRMIRGNAGPNAESEIATRGSGGLVLSVNEAGPIRFKTSASERMLIDALGNVGIGTNSPNKKLELANSIGPSTTLRLSASKDSNGNLQPLGEIESGYTSSAWADGYLGFNAPTATPYLTSPTRAMTILSNGNVGIGTSSPVFGLDVAGINTVARFGSGTSSTGINIDGAAGAVRDIGFMSGSSNRWTMRVNATAESGSNSGSNFQLINRSDAGAALTTTLFVNRASGNVGINTTNAFAKLDVVGTISATDAIQVGQSALACASGISGSIRFEPTSNTIQVCTGSTGWKSLASSTVAGGGGTPAGSTGDIQFNNAGAFAADTGQLFWDATNNRLGIGTGAPASALSVSGTGGVALFNTTATNTNIWFGVVNGATTSTYGVDVDNVAYTYTTGGYKFLSGGAAERIRMTPSGNVGIALQFPTAVFQVSGTFTVSRSDQLATAPSLAVGSAGNVGIGAINNGTSYVAIISGSTAFSKGSDAFNGSTHFPFSDGKNYIRGTTYIADNGGNVGIGKSSAIAMLDISGTVSASNAIQVGQSALACASGISGSIRYNTTSDTLQICTGSGWKSLVSGTAGGGGSDNLGNHIATMGLDMGGFTISNTNLLSTTLGGIVSGTYGYFSYVSGTSGYFPAATITALSAGGIGANSVSSSLVSATNISGTLIQVGGGNGASCDASRKGALRYSNTSSTVEYCNSSAWTSLGPSNTVPVSFRANNASTQTVTTNVFTKMDLGSETFDTNNNFASGRFTATLAGTYYFAGVVACKTTTNGCYSYIALNGSPHSSGTFTGAGADNNSISEALIQLGVGDHVELWGRNYGGTTMSTSTYFHGYLVGPQAGGGGGATPAGSTADVQYNSGGALAADTGNFIYASGLLTAPNISATTALNARNISGTQVWGTTVSGTYHYGQYTSLTTIFNPGSFSGNAVAVNSISSTLISATNISGTLIQTGASTATCGASLRGAIRYGTASNTLQICNSVGWVSLSSETSAGGGGGTPAGSTGDIQFNNGGSFAADTGQLFWDATNNRLGILTGTPGASLAVTGDVSITGDYYAGNGTNAAPSYSFFGDTNTGLYWITADTIGLTAGGTERARVNTSGMIVTGYVSTTGLIDIGTQALGNAGDSAATPTYSWSGDTNTGLFKPGADQVGLSTGGTERLRVLANGNVGIGTSAPTAMLEVSGGTVKFQNPSGTSGSITISGPAGAPGIVMYNTNNARAHIYRDASGLAFGAGPTASSPFDSLYLVNDGDVGISTSTPTAKLDVAGHVGLSGPTSNTISFGSTGVAAPAAGSAGMKIQLYGSTRGTMAVTDYAIGIEGSNMWFNTGGAYKWYAASGTQRMTLDSAGNLTAVAFLYSSDKRLKENVVSLTGGLAKFDAINPVSFSYISDTTHRKRLGVIAQEVEAVYPEAVVTDDKGMKTVDYPALIAPLIGAVKELKADNDNLRLELQSQKLEIQNLKKAVGR